MQNHATWYMYVRLCVHYIGNALVGPSMCSLMRTNRRRDRLNSLLKRSILRNLIKTADK